MRVPRYAVFVGLVVAAAITGQPVAAQTALKSRVHATGLNSPVAFVQDPTNNAVQFVVEQAGRIRVILNGAVQATSFLDLASVISSGGERGLLGMALAPDYSSTGRFYVNFTNPAGHTVIARFRRSTPLVADSGSRFDLRWPSGLRFISQPY